MVQNFVFHRRRLSRICKEECDQFGLMSPAIEGTRLLDKPRDRVTVPEDLSKHAVDHVDQVRVRQTSGAEEEDLIELFRSKTRF